MKWTSALGIICYKRVSSTLKGKFYCRAIRLTILYRTKCWMIKSQQENKLNVAEMRISHWISGHTRQDRIKNECIREKVGVVPIMAKMVERCLRWFDHV